MAKIPQNINTISKINKGTVKVELRPYLGMSQLGHSCSRYLWYSFRWCFKEELSARIIRLFNRGHREEPEVWKMLESVGVKCYGDQEEAEDIHGHCKGHIDGKCIGVIEAPKTEHLLEIKTMSDKYFKDVVKQGVKASKPIYYAQCQLYMKKFKLTRTLFVAVNKNDDSVYIERLKNVGFVADELLKKGESIILSEEPPVKMYKPTWWECRFCNANNICHNNAKPEVNCRTCDYLDLELKGEWSCNKHEKSRTTSQQRIPCDMYKKLEGLRYDSTKE